MRTSVNRTLWGTAMALGAVLLVGTASVNRVMASTPMAAPLVAPVPEGEGGDNITWLEVTLESAGSLGTEVLSKVEALADVEYLKVICSGSVALNSSDWTDLKNMTKLKQLDLRQTAFDAIPANEFDGRTTLAKIYLPEGMTTIGNYAFRKTILTSIDIPASVTSINQYAFNQVTTLTEVNFATGSALQAIGTYAFYQCTGLADFIMPNTVTSLGSNAFDGCSKLKNLSLSTSLTTIPECCFQNTSALKSVTFPESITSIGRNSFASSGLESVILPIGLNNLNEPSTYSSPGAFKNCKDLKYVVLPASVSYRSTFSGCTSLTEVVCPSCTPPVITTSYPPFTIGDYLDNVTLKVPSFSVVDYKLDTYWLNFGTIEAMETDPTLWSLWGDLTLTNNRRPTYVPDIKLNSGGSMIVGGESPFEINNMYIAVLAYNNNHGKLVNRSDMTALGTIQANYYVKKDNWYFLCPFTDVNLSDITYSTNASFVFRYYDSENRAANGTTNNASWKNVTESKLKAGQGYIFQSSADGAVYLPATADSKSKALTKTDVTTPLTAYASANVANANWNYVGNPYPCYYDIWYMDFSAPITVRDGSNYKTYSIVDDNYVLAPMQAFFVQKPEGVNSILFSEAGRQIESTVNRVTSTRRRAAANTDRRLYNITLSDGTRSDATRTILNEKASTDYEMTCDAAKFMSSDETMPQVYTIDPKGNQLAFNERPLADGHVRLGIHAGAAGGYTLSLENAADGVKLYDTETGQTTDLSRKVYQFNVASAGIYDDRFVLLFNDSNTTVISTTQTPKAVVNVVAGGVEISAETGTDITVYRANGSQYLTAKTQGAATLLSLPAGLYIVKVGNQAFKRFVY